MTITEFLLARIAEDGAAANDPTYVWSLDVGEPLRNPAPGLPRGVATVSECLIGDEWHQTFVDAGYPCCVRCRSHHRHPETCRGVDENGENID